MLKKRFGLMLIGLLLLTSGAFALDEIYVSNVTVIPPVATPGDVVYVSVAVRNASDDQIDDIYATLQQLSGDDLEITAINSKAEYLEPYGTATFTFAVKIPENPKEKYLLDLKIYTGINQYITRTIPIYTGAPTNLLIHAKDSQISAGECGYLQIDLENTSQDSVQNVVVAASSFAPVFVKSDVAVGTIAADSTKHVEIPVCADKDALSGIYPVAVTITYATGAGKGIAVRQIALKVKNRPELVVAGIRTEPAEVKERQEYTLHILLQNTSIEPAYQVGIEVDRNICDPETSNTVVTGETPLYRGMYEEITVHCRKELPAGAQSIPVKIHYKDRYGHEYTRNANVVLHVKPYPKVEIVGYHAENTETSEIGRVVVTLKNEGSETAKHVSLFVDPEWPFSTDEKRDYVDQIAPGEEKNAVIYVSVYPNAKTKNYGLDVRLEYEGPDDEKVTDTETLSIPVRKTSFPEFLASWVSGNWLFAVFSVAVLAGLAYLVVRAKKE